MLQTIGNLQLEMEYFTGRVLKTIEYPYEICLLAQCFCMVPDIFDGITGDAIPKIKSLMTTKQKRLNQNNLLKFYRGELPELLDLFLQLMVELDVAIDYLETLKIAEHQRYFAQVYGNIAQLQDFGYLGKIMQLTPPESPLFNDLERKQAEIHVFVKNAKACLTLYGRGKDTTIPTKQWKFDTLQDIQNSTYYMQQYIAQSSYPVLIVANIQSVLDMFNTLIPQMKLDPLYKDIFDELHKLLVNPDTYENAVKTRQVCEKTGSLFSQVYKEYAIEAGMELLPKYQELPEDEELCIEQGLGIQRDNGTLINFCSQYVNKNYRQGQ